MNNHPDWSFYGGDFPSNAELIEARNRVMAKHPKTHFVTLHCGNFSENLANVSENLDKYPNMSVDIAARIGELGRQPENLQEVLPTNIRTAFCLLPMQRRMGTSFRNRFSTNSYIESTTASSKPRTSISITLRQSSAAGAVAHLRGRLAGHILRKVYNGNATRALGITI